MEDPLSEQAAMVEFLRHERPAFAANMARIFAKTTYLPDIDVEAATAANYADLAERWRYALRRNAEYLAWRRERDPGYQPPDDPDPNDPENWTEERRREHFRAERLVVQARERIQGLSPERQRVHLHVAQAQIEISATVYPRLEALAARGDADVAELALIVADGLRRLEDLIQQIASDGATLDDSEGDEG